MIRMRYRGIKPLTLFVKDEKHVLHHGDEIMLEPWKMGPRLSLFEVHVDEDLAGQPQEVKKKLKTLRQKGFLKWEDPPEPPEEDRLEIIEDKRKRAEKGERV